MPRPMRPIGQTVTLVNGRQPPAQGNVVGYALISMWRAGISFAPDEGWVQAYVVRLSEGCDTSVGFYLRECVVTEEDIVQNRIIRNPLTSGGWHGE